VHHPPKVGWVRFWSGHTEDTRNTQDLFSFLLDAGLPDENFNKKPNNAKNWPEKGQTDCLKAEKSQTLFAVSPFLSRKKTSNVQEYLKKLLRN